MKTGYLKNLAYLLPVIVVYLCYLTLFKPGIELQIEMNVPSDGMGQFFFLTDSDNKYSEKNSKMFRVSKARSSYRLTLPHDALITRLRFDPIQHQGVIKLKRLTLWKISAFSRTKYFIDLLPENISMKNQISSIKKKPNNWVLIHSDGKDPYFIIDSLTKGKTESDWSPFTLLVITTIVFMGLAVAQVMGDGLTERDKNKWVVSLVVLVVLFLKMAYYNDNVAFGVPPDERAHYQYAMHLESEGLLLPDFGNMTIDGVVHNNYLAHPPLYYHMANFLLDYEAPKSGRVFNNYLIFLSLFFVIMVLHKYYKLDVFQHTFILIAFSSLPMLAFIGSSINNDGLGIFSGALFFYGVHSYFLERNYRVGANVIVLALFLAFFSKLTIFLLISFASVSLLMQLKVEFDKVSVSTYVFIVLVTMLIISYQVFISNKYGGIMPSLKLTNPDAYYSSGFFVPEGERLHFTHMEWFFRMLHYYWESYFNIHAHTSLVKPLGWVAFIIISAHVIGFGVLFYPAGTDSEKLIKAMLYAVIVVVIIQYVVTYNNRQSSGYTGGLQARYYLPFAMALPFAANAVISRLIKSKIRSYVYLFLAMFLVYGDFVYFILHTTSQVRFS